MTDQAGLKDLIQKVVIQELKDLRYTPTIQRQIYSLKSMIYKLPLKERVLYTAAISLLHDLEDQV